MVMTLCALACEGACAQIITCVCTSGGAHTCRPGGRAPLRLQAAPELPTRQPLPEGLPTAPLPWFHGALSRKPGILSPLGASVSLSRQWLAGGGVDPGDHRGLLSASAQRGEQAQRQKGQVQGHGAWPKPQALGPHGPHQPWAGGPASLCLRPVLRDNGCQPPARFPSARQPGGRLKRCGNNRETSRLL